MTIAAGGTLASFVTFDYQGGTISGGGTLDLSGRTVNLSAGLTVVPNLQVKLNDSTINGPGSLTVAQNATLAIDRASVNAPLANAGTIEAGDLTVTGAYTSGIGSTLCMQASPTSSLTVSVPGFTNNGLIQLGSTSSSGGPRILVITGGVLTNSATGTVSTLGTGNNSIRLQGQSVLDNRGTITVAAATTIDLLAAAPAAASNSGTIDVFGINGSLSISQAASGAFTNTGTVRVSTGRTITVSNGAFTNSGTLLVDPNSTFTAAAGLLTNGPGGTLAGCGFVVAAVAGSGTVSPGASPGVLTVTGGATLGGPFVVELNGALPGSGYDQFAVNGPVALSGATLAATFNATSVPAAGFVVIANDGTDPVSGTFAGLPEAATISAGGRLLRVSYRGGTGNDVVLTVLALYPSVTDVQVNAGQVDPVQRSRVTALAVTFDQVVAFANPSDVAAAFRLSRVGGGAVGGFTAAVNIVNSATMVTLYGFTGAETRFGSLVDGYYRLTVLAGQVLVGGQQLDGDGDGTPGGDYVLNGTTANGLFALYGDANGDGVVNAFDFSQFRSAFGSSLGDAAYRDWLDINGDGVINALDFAQFRSRFGSGVP